MMFKEIADFLNEKHLEYSFKKGKAVSQAEFAAYLEVPPPSFSRWMQGQSKPSDRYLDVMAEKLGPKMYDVAGVPRRLPNDKILVEFIENWPELNRDERLKLLDQLREMIDRKPLRRPALNHENG